LALLVAGIVYLELVLFQQVEFPLFGLWLVVVSGHELIGSRGSGGKSWVDASALRRFFRACHAILVPSVWRERQRTS